MIAAEAAEQRVVSRLMGEGALTSIGLASFRRESELAGIPLVEVLVGSDLVSEEDVAKTYAELGNLRYLDLTRRTPSKAAYSTRLPSTWTCS